MRDSYEQKLQGLYQGIDAYSTRAATAKQMSMEAVGNIGSYGLQAWEISKRIAVQIVDQGANQRKLFEQAAAATNGASYDLRAQIYKQQKELTEEGQRRIGMQKVAVAGRGLSFVGTPNLLIRETVDNNLREQKSLFMAGAVQDRNLRQQALNLRYQGAVTEQASRSQANAALAQGMSTLLESMKKMGAATSMQNAQACAV